MKQFRPYEVPPRGIWFGFLPWWRCCWAPTWCEGQLGNMCEEETARFEGSKRYGQWFADCQRLCQDCLAAWNLAGAHSDGDPLSDIFGHRSCAKVVPWALGPKRNVVKSRTRNHLTNKMTHMTHQLKPGKQALQRICIFYPKSYAICKDYHVALLKMDFRTNNNCKQPASEGWWRKPSANNIKRSNPNPDILLFGCLISSYSGCLVVATFRRCGVVYFAVQLLDFWLMVSSWWLMDRVALVPIAATQTKE